LLAVLGMEAVRSLAFLGQGEGLKASTETRSPDLWLLAQLPCLFLCLKNTSETSSYSTNQACWPVNLVITDNQRPETLSLPHGVDPPIKHTTHFSQATAPWSGWRAAHKSFRSTRGVVFIRQCLTEARASHILGKHFTAELYPRPQHSPTFSSFLSLYFYSLKYSFFSVYYLNSF
jgi:hypothetical protein